MINIFRELSNKDADERSTRIFMHKLLRVIQHENEQYRHNDECMRPQTKPKWK